jgi:hypothetical protein
MSKKNKRKRNPLNKSHTNKYRARYMDYDYTNKLSDEELEWLSKFTEEYYNDSFRRDGTDIHENIKEEYTRNYEKTSKSKIDEDIDTFTEVRRENHRKNIAMQNCIYTLQEVANRLTSSDIELDKIESNDILQVLSDYKLDLGNGVYDFDNTCDDSDDGSETDD